MSDGATEMSQEEIDAFETITTLQKERERIQAEKNQKLREYVDAINRNYAISTTDAREAEIARYNDGLRKFIAEQNRESDPVKSPSHYQILPGVEFIDVRKAIMGKIPEDTPFFVVDCWSRSFEYLARMWGKNGLEDAKKALTYLEWMIEEMENE